MASLLTSIKSRLPISTQQWTLLPTSSRLEKQNEGILLTIITLPFTLSLALTNLWGHKPSVKQIRGYVIKVLVGCVVVTCVSMVFALGGMTGYTVQKLGVVVDGEGVWRGFPVMGSYYGGIYGLVDREVNVAENTGPNRAPKAGGYGRVLRREVTTVTPSAAPEAKDPSKGSKESKSKEQKEGKGKSGKGGKMKPPKGPPKIAPKPIIYNPYPASTFTSCESLITNYTGRSMRVEAYKGVMKGMPDPAYGSYEALDLDDTICFERRTRFGIYGWKDRSETPKNSKDEDVLFDREWGVDWKSIQDSCATMNSGYLKKKKRTAVVIRVWDSYAFTRFDYVMMRSLIAELGVNTGGEYGVHLLMHVKDETVDLGDEGVRRKVLEGSIAREFWGITTLWSEGLMRKEYGRLAGVGTGWRGHDIYDAYRSMWLPHQWFSRNHEEYEYIWSLEMDVRYTGHWYHLFDKINTFARNQPRKGLWARNARFYVPSVHGSYEDFTNMVERTSLPEERVWGAKEDVDVVDKTLRVTPEIKREEEDEYSWGKGEEADLVTLSPIFEVVNTTWVIRDDFTGYGRERAEGENYNLQWDGPPRRGAVVAVYRFSKKLLNAMEAENRGGRHMGVEMFPASVALQYGLKAVYAPHPVFMDRRWPGRYLEGILNGGKGGSSGGSSRSLFGKREHHFGGSGFYYGSYWPKGVMGVWMGGEWEGKGGEGWERERGRGCLGGMLLHPVKEI
ncbi:hypothetical protein TWF481_010561 [Arthrobotrys musiformis]|uniref:Uncharacterized protein n=1 Tax=Arthrobotrys musiformis TaxID=47236 RepID=A0AAV9W189_9PEZI